MINITCSIGNTKWKNNGYCTLSGDLHLILVYYNLDLNLVVLSFLSVIITLRSGNKETSPRRSQAEKTEDYCVGLKQVGNSYLDEKNENDNTFDSH